MGGGTVDDAQISHIVGDEHDGHPVVVTHNVMATSTIEQPHIMTHAALSHDTSHLEADQLGVGRAHIQTKRQHQNTNSRAGKGCHRTSSPN